MTAPETRVPELVGGIDVRTLPLSALEGFVLSRVDGRSPIREIVAVTALPVAQVVDILERLRNLGAVSFRGEASQAPKRESPAQKPEPTRSGGARAQAARPAAASSPAQPRPKPSAPAAPARAPNYNPRELEEECDLPPERRKQVLDLFYALADIDYYEALELPYNADKKQIRAAYFALSKAFHPDTMFRKNLGSFKAKMEQVFKVLTEAYDTLGKKKTREEYDAYLRATKSAQMAERALAMSAQQAAEAEAALNVELPPPPPVPQIARAGVSSLPPADGPSPAGRVNREASPEARRLAQEVIARRFRGVAGGAGRPPAQPSAPQAAPPAATPSKAPATPVRTDPKELLRRLATTLKDVGKVTGTNDPVQRTVTAAQAALARGDLEGATQLMRKAVSLAPERPDLVHEHEQLSKLLSEKLAADYEVKAQFEMKHGKWAAAALAWSKVCEGKPKEAQPHRLAAMCLLKVGGDLRGAQKYAQQAAFLAPNDLDIRVLNAQIYLTLGLKLNAKRELDVAAKLDPESEMVKNLLSDLMKS